MRIKSISGRCITLACCDECGYNLPEYSYSDEFCSATCAIQSGKRVELADGDVSVAGLIRDAENRRDYKASYLKGMEEFVKVEAKAMLEMMRQR
jgi:hypothetical protein